MSTDAGNVRLAIIFLGLLAVICLGGGIYLVHDDKSMPEALIAIGSSAATAVTLVVTRPIGGVQSVEVVNADANAVPVEPQPVKAAARKRTKRT